MSKRIQRVNQLIKEEMSQLIQKKAELPPGVLVTVTRVETADDIRDANIFVSVFPEKDFDKIFAFLNKRIGFFQKELNALLRMRPLPRIRFIMEKETAKAARIEEILEQLKNEEK